MLKLLPKLASLLLGILPLFVHAQTGGIDSVLAAPQSVRVATQQYINTVQPESSLFNGAEYINYAPPGTIGHQFFLDVAPQLGTVHYSGAYFENILLNYDLVLDRVVLTYPSRLVMVGLVSERISAFTLGEHSFVRLGAAAATGTKLPTGFCEVLLGGPISLLARRTKQYHAKAQQKVQFEYNQTNKLFIKTTTTTSELTSLKQLLALLPAHKADVQQYARQHGLRFSAAEREASALKALLYYYTLAEEPQALNAR